MNPLLFTLLILSIGFLSSCASNPAPNEPSTLPYTSFRAKQKSFASTQGNIKYLDQGKASSKAPILLLHGIPSSGWLYRKMVDELVAKGHRVIVPDMLGYGASTNPEGYDIYNEAGHATRILALMDHLKIKRWNHVCHDAGGLWTWELAKKDPKRFASLSILNSVILEEGFHPPIRMQRGPIARLAMWGYRSGVTTNLLLKGLFKEGLLDSSIPDHDREGYRRPLVEGKTNGMLYFFSQTCNKLPDYREVLKSINTPTQVIWGKHDEMLTWEDQAQEVTSYLGIKDKDIHLIEAKHFIQEEQPEQICKFINAFAK